MIQQQQLLPGFTVFYYIKKMGEVVHIGKGKKVPAISVYLYYQRTTLLWH